MVDVNRRRRIVTADDGTEACYDRLLVATGSTPFVPPIPGTGLEGVVSYRDIDDTETMIAASASHRHAVVIGGGLLGLEAANGLMRRGMEVTVVHLAPWLMERQLDETAARLLQTSLEQRGLRFVLGANTTGLLGDAHAGQDSRGALGRVRAVRLADGRELPAQLVVVAAGIRPEHRARRDRSGCIAAAASSSATRCRRSPMRASMRSANAPPIAASPTAWWRRSSSRRGSARRISRNSASAATPARR